MAGFGTAVFIAFCHWVYLRDISCIVYVIFSTGKDFKRAVQSWRHHISFRKVLVVTQFAISIILIITTVIVFQQLHYMQNASLGYDKEHIITTTYNTQLNDKYESFRNTLLQNPNVKEVGRS